MGTLFLYPVVPRPNTTYHFSEDLSLSVSFAVDNAALARRFGYGFSWNLTTPDRPQEPLQRIDTQSEPGEDDGEGGAVPDDDIGFSTRRTSLQPGLYHMSWEFSLPHCYTRTVSRRERYSRGRGSSTSRWVTREEERRGTLVVNGGFDFTIDRENGTEIVPFEEAGDPDTYGPGTMIAQILGPYEHDEDCAVLNPQDWVYDPTPTREPDPTRTVPGDPVPSRATTVPASVTPVQSIDPDSGSSMGVPYPQNVPLLLCLWFLAGLILRSV